MAQFPSVNVAAAVSAKHFFEDCPHAYYFGTCESCYKHDEWEYVEELQSQAERFVLTSQVSYVSPLKSLA